MSQKQSRKLDRSRPFGEIFGAGDGRFEQFGIMFDIDGDELPGYEHIEIPPETLDAAGGAGDQGHLLTHLQTVIDQLRNEKSALQSTLEDTEAQVEELQGQLDTANIQVARLTEQVAALTKSADPDNGKQKTGKGKGEPADPAKDQLDLQTGGAAS